MNLLHQNANVNNLVFLEWDFRLYVECPLDRSPYWCRLWRGFQASLWNEKLWQL